MDRNGASLLFEIGRENMKIIDTHLHLWDLSKCRLPWLSEEFAILKRNFDLTDYLAEIDSKEFEIEQAVYIEVDAAPEDTKKENKWVHTLLSEPNIVTGSILKMDLLAADIDDQLQAYSQEGATGVRHVLHTSDSAPGTCLHPMFQANMHKLGENNLLFEACMRTNELADLVVLAKECPETTIVLNHCGNIDCNLLADNEVTVEEEALMKQWRKQMSELGRLENVVCKLSGLNVENPAALDQLVDILLDNFSHDKIVFGGNYPVCLLNQGLSEWLQLVKSSLDRKNVTLQQKIFYENAKKIYQLE